MLDAIALPTPATRPPTATDAWSAACSERSASHFGDAGAVFLVFNGTGANVLCIRAGAAARGEAVICAETAHINVDEGGAPEAVAGAKLLTCRTPDGKLTPDDVRRLVDGTATSTSASRGLVSITQSDRARHLLHADGAARRWPSCAHGRGLRCTSTARGCRQRGRRRSASTLRELATDAGSTCSPSAAPRTGCSAEAVVLSSTPRLAAGFAYLRKQTLQLASKMRFICGPVRRAAGRRPVAANGGSRQRDGARVWRTPCRDVPGPDDHAGPCRPTPCSRLPPPRPRRCSGAGSFYVWDEATGEVRWMCSWSTQPRTWTTSRRTCAMRWVRRPWRGDETHGSVSRACTACEGAA